MPSITIQQPVTVEQAARALQSILGSRYRVTTQGKGTEEAIKVRQSAASSATVHTQQSEGVTKFSVHGGGLLISRMINEIGIAKTVAAAIEEALEPAQPRTYTDKPSGE